MLPNSRRFLVAGTVGLLVVPISSSAQENGAKESASDTLEAPPPAVEPSRLSLGRDTVVASPGKTYPAGAVRRLFMGALNRELWGLEFAVPILDLDSVGGGLEIDELSGGKQTLGIRFRGRDGLIYQFRSIVKTPSRAIPSMLRSTAVESVTTDQMAAQFPLSAMVVAELLEAAGVMVAKPRPVVMPDDARLGEFREAFAGRMGWIEIRPDERETEDGFEYAGFAGSDKITGSEELFEELRDNPSSYVDARRFLRARLVDMIVGDWDRHADQWRWASYPDGERTRWEPIPRDRDWAFAKVDGLIPTLAAVYLPKYVGFKHEPPDPWNLHWSAQRLDRMHLSGLDRGDFMDAALDLQHAFSDDVIDRAVGVLPESYKAAIGDELTASLRLRRDALPETASRFYEILAGWVDIPGTEEIDSVAVVAEKDSVRVTMWAPRDGDFVRYDRVLLHSETKDIRIYLWDGDDRVVIHGSPTIPVRLVGGKGDDLFVDEGDGTNVIVYDEGEAQVDLGSEAILANRYLGQDSLETAYMLWDPRDWGSAWVPRPELWFDSDIGPYGGLGVSRYGFGFGQAPYHSRLSVSLLNGFGAGQWIANLEYDRALGERGWGLVTKFEARTEEPVWLFGFGNDVPEPDQENDFRSFRGQVLVRTGMRFKASADWSVTVGPEFSATGGVEPGGEVFDAVDVYGSDRFRQAGLAGEIAIDTRDSEQYPLSGRRWTVEARVVPSLMEVEDTFGGLRAEVREYVSADLPGEPALHVRLTGEKVWGRTPFFALPYLGGSSSLPGFTSRRFVGDGALSATGLGRLKVLETNILTDLEVGLHGIATVGRVWYEDDSSKRWHSGTGGGLWLRLPSIDRTVSVSAVQGDAGPRFYLDFGFLF